MVSKSVFLNQVLVFLLLALIAATPVAPARAADQCDDAEAAARLLEFAYEAMAEATNPTPGGRWVTNTEIAQTNMTLAHMRQVIEYLVVENDRIKAALREREAKP